MFSRSSFLLLGFLFVQWCSAGGQSPSTKRYEFVHLPYAMIIGGEYAQQGEYPWMVSIHEFNEGFDHICGGAILNKHWIITAAHCIDFPDEPWKYQVYVGLHRLSKRSRNPKRKYILSKVIKHAKFERETFDNDIALLRTKKPIDFKNSRGRVKSIRLPDTNRDPTGWATVTGWGHTKEDGENSDVLKEAKIPIIPRKKCIEIFEEDAEEIEVSVDETKICAGAPERDSCQNDSGGPLVQKNKKGVYILIGVVSSGIGCARGYPGIYTKVASHMNWLEKKMKN